MKRIWMRKAKSFAEAHEHDLEYYYNMSAKKRLEIVQFLREQYPKFARVNTNESGKRLRRIVTIV